MKALVPVLLLLTSLTWGQGESIERYALFAGSNVGGRGTAALKYATGDAKRFQQVLTKLGGLKEENSLLLVNPARENLLQGLAFLESKIRRNRVSDRQAQMVFYYSGHSDNQGLLLGGERLTYQELKDRLDGIGAEVQVVVLDSCSSGAFTRTKGGAITAPFMVDIGTEVEGHAFLTSSTAEELSQESDRIESSFFTHALVEGLRGAADANGDGKVTLNEAYEYAYSRTTSDTQATVSGTQHPAFDIQLNGKGNLVLTDLRTGGATLVFPKSLTGKVSVRDISNKLVAEISKNGDQELQLGVEEGYYRIGWETGGRLSESAMIVDERRSFLVAVDQFKTVERQKNPTRGVETNRLDLVPLGLTVTDIDGVGLLSYNLGGGQLDQQDGMMLALLYNAVKTSGSGFQAALFANDVQQDFHGFQATLGYNHIESAMAGVQLGAINNAGELRLGQLGLVNLSVEGRGFQAGLWNQTETFQGLQWGLVNYADDLTGVQVGLINISKKLTGLPIGLIDIQFNGQNHIDQTFGFTGASWDSFDQDVAENTYFRFGSEYFYKYFSVGSRLGYSGTQEVLPALSLGIGLGFRVPALLPGFAFHIDGGTAYERQTSVLDFRSDNGLWQRFVPQFRTFASWSFWQNFGVLLGWEHPVYTKYYHEAFSTAGKTEIKTDWGTLYMANRFFLGIQL